MKTETYILTIKIQNRAIGEKKNTFPLPWLNDQEHW